MTELDIEARRARDRERYHRQTAERRDKGLCLTCGHRPPVPGRTRCEPCAAKKRPGDRARYHRQATERVAHGLCPKCGHRPPAPERSQCAPCLEKDAAAGRARDARLRAAGIPRRDPEKTREYERERTRRVAGARRAEWICTSCGSAPAAPGRVTCEPCLEQRRADDRARYAAGKAAGKPYGGADPETKRRAARARHKRCKKAWRAAGLCVACGKPPEVEGTACSRRCATVEADVFPRRLRRRPAHCRPRTWIAARSPSEPRQTGSVYFPTRSRPESATIGCTSDPVFSNAKSHPYGIHFFTSITSVWPLASHAITTAEMLDLRGGDHGAKQSIERL